MYRRRCEPDERVLLVRGGRLVKHTVRYIPLFLKSGENVPEAARSRLVRGGGFTLHMVHYTHSSYSTVTLLARFLGLSTSNPLETLT